MYIGKQPIIGNFQVCDAISTVNNQAAYTLQVGGANVSPETVNNMIVSVNGVIQKPTASYTVAGSTITFTSNLVTGDVIDFIQILGSVLDLGTPSDATVTTAKIANANVTTAKIADGAVTGVKASGLNTPSFSVFKSSAQSIPNATITKVTFDTEDFDTDSAFASSRFTVPAGKNGKYLFYTKLQSDSTSGETVNVYFYKNGSSFVKHRQSIHASNRRTFQATAILNLAATDYVEVFKDQDGGSARNIDGDGNRISYFSGYKLS